MVVQIVFFSILQIWYVEVRISRTVSEGPFDFEITRVDCIYFWLELYTMIPGEVGLSIGSLYGTCEADEIVQFGKAWALFKQSFKYSKHYLVHGGAPDRAKHTLTPNKRAIPFPFCKWASKL